MRCHGAGRRHFGVAWVWALVQGGAHVRVIEAAQIGAGAPGGLVGALTVKQFPFVSDLR